MTDDVPPTTAMVEQLLAGAAKVLIVEGHPSNANFAEAPRIAVSGAGIAELARLLAIVDGGTGDLCRCLGWPTIILLSPAGDEFAQLTLHHQTGLRGVGNCDADLRDGPALTDWLAERGLTHSREVQELLARYAAAEEERRQTWVRAAPPDLTAAAEAASRREDDAEDRLVDLVSQRYPDPVERIRTLVAWAGFPPRYPGDGGTPWHEHAPQRMLLTEPVEAVFAAMASAPLTPAQLDGAAELFTALEWHADLPAELQAALIAHVSATGTDPMKFRMRHGYGADATS